MADATTDTDAPSEADAEPKFTDDVIEPVTWESTRFSLTLAVDDRPVAQIGVDVGVRREDKAILDPILDRAFRMLFGADEG